MRAAYSSIASSVRFDCAVPATSSSGPCSTTRSAADVERGAQGSGVVGGLGQSQAGGGRRADLDPAVARRLDRLQRRAGRPPAVRDVEAEAAVERPAARGGAEARAGAPSAGMSRRDRRAPVNEPRPRCEEAVMRRRYGGGERLVALVELVDAAPRRLVARRSTRRSARDRPTPPGRRARPRALASATSAAAISLLEALAARELVLGRAAAVGPGARRAAAPAQPSARARRAAPRARAGTRASRRCGCAACRPRSRPCACRPRRAARGRGRRAAASRRSPGARPRAPRAPRGRGGWSARRGAGRWPRTGRGRRAPGAGARRPRARRAASRPPRPRTGSGRAARAPCPGVRPVARWAAVSTVPSVPSSSACWDR